MDGFDLHCIDGIDTTECVNKTPRNKYFKIILNHSSVRI